MATSREHRRLPLLLAASASALLVLGCRPSPPPAPPNLLLIVSDALRADALSCYGGASQTPAICGLAARGLLFENAYAAASWTLPSVAAMMGGSYPTVYARGSGGTKRQFRIPDSEVLLGEALRAAGYDTFAHVENPIARQGNAFQGMEERLPPPPPPGSAADLFATLGFDSKPARNRRLTRALHYLATPGQQPFFLVVWIDDPHAPYRPLGAAHAALAQEAAALPRPFDYYRGLGHTHRPEVSEHKLREELPRLSPRELDFLRRLYLAEVESVDERVGFLVRALGLSGRAESTYVVLTSDHGESFGEHGSFLHGETFYGETVRVPLIFAGPELPRGVRRGEPVSHVDLMPTLADLLGARCLEDPQGQSLRSLLAGGRGEPWQRRSIYLTNPLRQRDGDAVVRGRHKLIREGDRFELYDFVADPGERTNLAAAEPALVAELRAELERLRHASLARQADRLRQSGPTPDADAETLRQLRALGYLD